jgi:hypothetical protein
MTLLYIQIYSLLRLYKASELFDCKYKIIDIINSEMQEKVNPIYTIVPVLCCCSLTIQINVLLEFTELSNNKRREFAQTFARFCVLFRKKVGIILLFGLN